MHPIRCLSLFIVIFCCLYLIESTTAEHDFQFNDEPEIHQPNEDVAKASTTTKTTKKFINIANNRNIYSKEVTKCDYSDIKIMLSLVLKSNDWKDIIGNKRSRIIHKLSKFFAISEESIRMESISRRDIHDMTKRSIKRGPNKCNTNRQLGKIEFMIGCGQSYFKVGQSIANQISEQMKDGTIDDITQVDFGWWVIWRKRISNRVPRSKRENKLTDELGSGEDEEVDYQEEEYGDYDEDITEAPLVPSSTTTHAHRHHHGLAKSKGDSKIIPIDISNNVEITKSKNKKNNLKPQPIDEDFVKQLESVITKTIENTEKVKPLEESTTSSIMTNIKYPDDDDDDDDVDYLIDEMNVDDTGSVAAVIPSTLTTASAATTTKYPPKINNNNERDEYVSTESQSKIIRITEYPIITSSLGNSISSSTFMPSSTNVITTSTKKITTSTSTTTAASVTLTSIPQEIITTQIISNISNKIINTPTTLSSNQFNKNLDEITTIETTLTDDYYKNNKNYNGIISNHNINSSSNNNNNNNNNNNKWNDKVLTTTPSTVLLSSSSPTFKIRNFNEFYKPSTISHLNSIISDFITEQSPTVTASTISPTTVSTIPLITSSVYTTTLASIVMGKDYEDTGHTEPSKEDELTFETTTMIVPISNYNDLSSEPNVMFGTTDSTILPGSPSTVITTSTTTVRPTTTSTTTQIAVTEYIEPEPVNQQPIIKIRLQRQRAIAGKLFSLIISEGAFYDNEDQNNLRLELFDQYGKELESNSWLQFNSETREIYGLPLDNNVSKYEYKLMATDSRNASVSDDLQITVQQYAQERSYSHAIYISLELNKKYFRNIDWQIQLLHSIAAVLSDDSINVRNITTNMLNPRFVTLSFVNETLANVKCPASDLDHLVERLDANRLADLLSSDMIIKSINGRLSTYCTKPETTTTAAPSITVKNHPPSPRNPVDRVNATVGHLLVYRVPDDTFYDVEDGTNLKLTLLSSERDELPARHWLQFDSKNKEFYGIPKAYGSEQYILAAEDSGGLKAHDALEVVISHPLRKEFSVLFKAYLGMRHEQFTPIMQRKFVEQVAKLFRDKTTQYIQIRSITTHHDTDGTIVNFYNTTLFRNHSQCPEIQIENVRYVWFSLDSILRDNIKHELREFHLTNLQMVPLASCHYDHPRGDIIPIRSDNDIHLSAGAGSSTTFAEDYLYTFILPAIIILIMIFFAAFIACILHRRRLTGKMELGDEEERKSFRSRGIPVIFQDELDEKPEIGNKSPIILKDEKPPLLPPSYNSTNVDGDNDCDEYVPPPAVVIGGREIRGKSPVTPSYRKPPPYVSP